MSQPEIKGLAIAKAREYQFLEVLFYPLSVWLIRQINFACGKLEFGLVGPATGLSSGK